MAEDIKIRLMVSPERYSELAEVLRKHGIEPDDTSELILTEKSSYPSYLIGKQGEEIFRLPVGDISHIESFAHEVIAHTAEGDFRLGDRLVRLSQLLDPAEFVRISKSVIVSLSHVKSIAHTYQKHTPRADTEIYPHHEGRLAGGRDKIILLYIP